MCTLKKIFIASSITQFSDDRTVLCDYIYKLSDITQRFYNVRIEPIICEHLPDAYRLDREQDEYNDIIRGSDMCIFMFDTRFGEYTAEEFDAARTAFNTSGKPGYYIFIKNNPEHSVQPELREFKSELERENFFYTPFDFRDDIKLRILLDFKLQELPTLDVDVCAERLTVRGTSVAFVNNISEFKNDPERKKLKSTINTCREDDKPDYIEKLNKLDNSILSRSLEMAQYAVSRDFNPEMTERYIAFLRGEPEQSKTEIYKLR